MHRVVLITGCRSGFGLRAAVTAARRGYAVYAGLRDLATAGDLTRAASGLDVTPIQLDVTRAEEREAAVARVLNEQGRLDGLVNNAGVALGGFLEQVEEDELRRLFDVNVFGAWAMTKACLPTLRDGGGGTVIQISSVSGRAAWPGQVAYAGSKFALEGLSEAWRHELRPFGIHMVLVEPGSYRTDIFGRNRTLCRHAKDPDSPYAPWMESMDQLVARVVDRTAGDPQEVADLIVRLLDDPHPPLRVPLGPLGRSRDKLRQLLPYSVFEFVFAQGFRWLRRD